MAQAEKRGMREAVDLLLDGVIQLLLPVAVDVAPKRRNAVEIFSSRVIHQIVTIGPADDDGILFHPLLHLRKRMPQVVMIDLLQSLVIGAHASSFSEANASKAFSIC